MVMTLFKAATTAQVTQAAVAQKYDGSASDAVKAAIDDALENILGKIEN